MALRRTEQNESRLNFGAAMLALFACTLGNGKSMELASIMVRFA